MATHLSPVPRCSKAMLLAGAVERLAEFERALGSLTGRLVAVVCRRGEVLQAIRRVEPDLLLLDARVLPRARGPFLAAIRRERPLIVIHIIESGGDLALIDPALGLLAAGATVDLTADAVFEELVRSLYMDWQPLVRGRDGGLYGFEALVRAEHPRWRTAPQVLGLAAALRRELDLEAAILRECARDAVEAALPGRLLINVSVPFLMSDLLGGPEDPLLPLAHRVVLEVNEQGAIDSIEEAAARCGMLRALGYEIALDDLGSGRDYLARLLAMQPSVFKLDRLALSGCDGDSRKRRYVHAIVAMAHEEGALVVAEGVERREEAELAVALGCDLLQGYYLARPHRSAHWSEQVTASPAPGMGPHALKDFSIRRVVA